MRFYATGSWLQTAGDFIGIHRSTGSRIVSLVSHCIAKMARKFINFPTSIEERNQVAAGFYSIAKFPQCIGAIDCTHVRIQSPGGANTEIYRNRKGFCSFNVQTVVDATGRIQNIVVCWPGSSHDSTIFNHSRIRHQFENGEFNDFVLVGDSGYGLTKYLLTPLGNPQNEAEDLYNEAQIRTRNPVERSYGIWKRRFPILSFGIRVKLDRIESIIVATAVLHNIATFFRLREPRTTSAELEAIALTENVPVHQVHEANNINVREMTRSKYINYFHSVLQNNRA